MFQNATHMIQKCCKYNFDSNDTFGSVCLKEKQKLSQKDEVAMEVMDAIFGGTPTSKLFINLL